MSAVEARSRQRPREVAGGNGRSSLITDQPGISFPEAPFIVFRNGLMGSGAPTRRVAHALERWRAQKGATTPGGVIAFSSDLPIVGKAGYQREGEYSAFVREALTGEVTDERLREGIQHDRPPGLIEVDLSAGGPQGARQNRESPEVQDLIRKYGEGNMVNVAVDVAGAISEGGLAGMRQRQQFMRQVRALPLSFIPGTPHQAVEALVAFPHPDGDLVFEALHHVHPDKLEEPTVLERPSKNGGAINYRRRLPIEGREILARHDEKIHEQVGDDPQKLVEAVIERGRGMLGHVLRAYASNPGKWSEQENPDPWESGEVWPILALGLLQFPTRINGKSWSLLWNSIGGNDDHRRFLAEAGVVQLGVLPEIGAVNPRDQYAEVLRLDEPDLIVMGGHTHSSIVTQPADLGPVLDIAASRIRPPSPKGSVIVDAPHGQVFAWAA